MNINKFTQKSIEAVNNCEKIAYDYGNQEIEQERRDADIKPSLDQRAQGEDFLILEYQRQCFVGQKNPQAADAGVDQRDGERGTVREIGSAHGPPD